MLGGIAGQQEDGEMHPGNVDQPVVVPVNLNPRYVAQSDLLPDDLIRKANGALDDEKYGLKFSNFMYSIAGRYFLSAVEYSKYEVTMHRLLIEQALANRFNLGSGRVKVKYPRNHYKTVVSLEIGRPVPLEVNIPTLQEVEDTVEQILLPSKKNLGDNFTDLKSLTAGRLNCDNNALLFVIYTALVNLALDNTVVIRSGNIVHSRHVEGV